MNDKTDDMAEIEKHAKLEADKLGIVSEGGGAFSEKSHTADTFWDDAKTDQAYLRHRIPELHAWLVYQYKQSLDGHTIRIRTLQYKMTTRPTDKPWYRGNLNLDFYSRGPMYSIESPDSMWQEVQPSNFISYVRESSIPSNGKSIVVRIACNFDGTSNDGWEHSSWVTHTDIKPVE